MTGSAIALPPIALRPLVSMQVAVDGLLIVGGPHGAGRRVGTICGGTLDGERLRGAILGGGSDWQTVRGDGAILLEARIVVRTHDGALIAITYTGIRHGLPDVMTRLGRGEPVDPADYYFRIVPTFTTSDPRYEWLNRVVAIGTGHRFADGPVYHIDEIV